MQQDRIIIEGITCYGYHGVLPSERELGQTFVVDLEMAVSLRRAGMSDDLAETVDYSQVFHLMQQIVSGDPCLLIEAVAERVAEAVLTGYPVEEVLVRVKKPHVSMGGVFNFVAVEIRRKRDV